MVWTSCGPSWKSSASLISSNATSAVTDNISSVGVRQVEAAQRLFMFRVGLEARQSLLSLEPMYCRNAQLSLGDFMALNSNNWLKRPGSQPHFPGRPAHQDAISSRPPSSYSSGSPSTLANSGNGPCSIKAECQASVLVATWLGSIAKSSGRSLASRCTASHTSALKNRGSGGPGWACSVLVCGAAVSDSTKAPPSPSSNAFCIGRSCPRSTSSSKQ
mmetsp:Transcript_19639/g.38541  ORF Transcript_19639/g.38541 Transcript_19639/m.38541 type:complete len:217 (+) Transcript_19639:1008-1658(+)